MDFNDSAFDDNDDQNEFMDDFDFDDLDGDGGDDAGYQQPNAQQSPRASKQEKRGGLLSDLGDLLPMLLPSGRNANILMGVGIFIVGLLVGWVVLGWYVAPVKWVDANASHLRADLQEDYMRMSIDSYVSNPNVALAQQRLAEFGEGTLAAEVLARIEANPGSQNIEVIRVFKQFAGADLTPEVVATDPATGQAIPADPAETSGPSTLFFTMLFLLTLGLGAVIVIMVMRRRRGSQGITPAQAARQYTEQIQSQGTDFEAMGQDAPVAQWMTTYLIGDDLFDDSFSIDAPSGEFLGECGVGIADTVGVGEPKRVSAFEVWLFDKNDIQTVTKVMMSNHVFSDGVNRERLSAKGEPVLVSPGEQAVLETETLQMVARVVDMAYGQGALPDNSFFERVTIELAVWPK